MTYQNTISIAELRRRNEQSQAAAEAARKAAKDGAPKKP